MSYGDKQTTWGSILLLKTRELSHYLTGKTKKLDFINPEFGIFRVNSQEIRQEIKVFKQVYHQVLKPKRMVFSINETVNYKTNILADLS